MTSSATSALSAPSNAYEIVMGYLQEKSEKTGLAQTREREYFKAVKDHVYDVFAKSVIRDSDFSIIFLDISGVVYNNRHDGSVQMKARELFPDQEGHPTDEQCDIAATHLFDKTALSALRKVFFNTRNAVIVLSSDWRDNKSVPKIRSLFSACFFSHWIFDKTPGNFDKEFINAKPFLSDYSGRGKEIAYWLKEHPSITNFVILDDYDDGLSRFNERFVKINAEKLLTDTDVEKAGQILNDRMTD